MKKKIISGLCAFSMLISSMVTSVFAEDTYKKVADADFDTKYIGNITASSSKIAEENGNKYLTASGYHTIDYTTGQVVVDLRARFDQSNYNSGSILTRDGGTGKTWERTTDVQFTNTSWYYYRLIYDFENQTVSALRSENGWNDLVSYTLVKVEFKQDASGNYPEGMASLKFDRLQVDDIMIYQNGTAPSADVEITKNGDVVTAAYTFIDAEGDREGNTTIKWQVSDDNVTYTDIDGATGTSYELTEEESNKYVRAVVVPKSVRYPAEGAECASDGISVGKIRKYSSYVNEDFEGDNYSINIGSNKVIEGDETNTSKYLEVPQNLDLKGYDVELDGTVVEFRGKSYTENTIPVTFIEDSAWKKTFPAVISYTTTWRWYRFVFDVTDGVASYTVQQSTDRINWTPASLSSTSKLPSTMSKFIQIRFSKAYIDDLAVYQNGTAPVATAGISQEGTLLTASYTYNDKDNDDALSCIKYQWQKSSDGVEYENIAGATNATYTLSSSDLNFYVRCAVIPISVRYPQQGEVAYSNGILYKETKFGNISYTIDGTQLNVMVPVEPVSEKDAIIILAVFEGDRFVEAILGSPQKVLTSTTEVTGSFDISGVETGNTVKLMLWNSISLITPHTQSVAFTKE